MSQRNSITQEMKETILHEINEREEHNKRKNNLVLYGVIESDKNSVREKEKEDQKLCCRIIKDELKLGEAKVNTVIRLGKPHEVKKGREQNVKQRPLLVKMRDSYSKFEALKRGKALRNSQNMTLRKVIVTSDLTRKERERDRKLRMELKAKKDKGERGWYIKKGELMQNF